MLIWSIRDRRMCPGGVSVMPAKYTSEERSNFSVVMGVFGFLIRSSSSSISATRDNMLNATPTRTLA
uniref:Uncharacterized protein n=1 Tax=Zea mays TaxID=4577 RepID=C4J774_MAIZE|nr:unknown [Zea mays]